jgi:hypothetical protein
MFWRLSRTGKKLYIAAKINSVVDDVPDYREFLEHFSATLIPIPT